MATDAIERKKPVDYIASPIKCALPIFYDFSPTFRFFFPPSSIPGTLTFLLLILDLVPFGFSLNLLVVIVVEHFADRFRETAALRWPKSNDNWLEIDRETSFYIHQCFIPLVFPSLSRLSVRNFYDPGHEKMWSNGYNRRPGRRIISVWYIDTCVCVCIIIM